MWEPATRGDCRDNLANDAVGDETVARGELVRFMTILAGLEGIEVGVNEGVGTRKEELEVGIGVSMGSGRGRVRGIDATGSEEVQTRISRRSILSVKEGTGTRVA